MNIEEVSKNIALLKFTAPATGMLRKFIGNDTTTINKFSRAGLGVKKGKCRGVSMMLKTEIEVAQDYTFSNYIPPIPQKYIKSQYRKIVAGTGVHLAPKLVLPDIDANYQVITLLSPW